MQKFTGALCTLALAAATLTTRRLKPRTKPRWTSVSTPPATIIEQVMAAPDHAIPETVLGGAKCVLVIPLREKEVPFLVGAQLRSGSRHLPHRATAGPPPSSLNSAASASDSRPADRPPDLVLLGMNDKSVQDMLHSKVKLVSQRLRRRRPRRTRRPRPPPTSCSTPSSSPTPGPRASSPASDLSGDVLESNNDELHAEYGP